MNKADILKDAMIYFHITLDDYSKLSTDEIKSHLINNENIVKYYSHGLISMCKISICKYILRMRGEEY